MMLRSPYFKGEAPIYPEGCIRVMYDSQNHSKIMKCGFEAWFYQAGAKCSMVTTYQGSKIAIMIQNQTGRHPTKCGTVVEVLQYHQYAIRIDGSG
jgi:hypothetical protein